MWLLQLIITIALFGLSGLIGYLWFFALCYFVRKKPTISLPTSPQSRFAFVVPAHNEERGIAATVHSLLQVRYPRSLFDVVVVADNCTDKTAEQARIAGALSLERDDTKLRGKGYALSFAFNHLLTKNYQAIVVVDADSIVTENFLELLDARLQLGESVIQAYDGLANPDASILTYLFQVGNLIENKLYWEPKETLGLPIMLRGNGMCFSTEVLTTHPWSAFSIVEDTEYGLQLIQNAIPVHFAAEIGVYAIQPETLEQAFEQRVRWASGNATITKGRAFKLIQKGLQEKNKALIDIGIGLIVGSRPLLIVLNVLLIVMALLAGSRILLWWGCSLLILQVLYILCGVLLHGITLKKLARLFGSPFYLAWLCMVSLLGLVGFRKNLWVRTSRQ
jgi:cellulose synthase/poly-beta-1,6-N-acetylglucosamine synthase-like glycosyltransferase